MGGAGGVYTIPPALGLEGPKNKELKRRKEEKDKKVGIKEKILLS